MLLYEGDQDGQLKFQNDGMVIFLSFSLLWKPNGELYKVIRKLVYQLFQERCSFTGKTLSCNYMWVHICIYKSIPSLS